MAGDLDRHSDSYGCLALFAGVLILGLVILAVVWFVSTVGHVLELTPTYPEIDKHGHAWIEARYQNVAWGYVLTVLTLVAGVPLSVARSGHADELAVSQDAARRPTDRRQRGRAHVRAARR